ncbi:MAG: beta-propeller domain-containing protein [Eggerthellaceae bacterium]|nr:beta-propeller domain-containing protein [Eggerthellaceae bacterium]
MKRTLSLIILAGALCLACFTLAACDLLPFISSQQNPPLEGEIPGEEPNQNPGQNPGNPASSYLPKFSEPVKGAASYDEIFDALTAAYEKQQAYYLYGTSAAGSPAPPTAREDSNTEMALGAVKEDGGYSQTNVQVEGIDESDIVKTDGKSIFLISGTDVIIFEPKGADTEEIARISVTADTLNKEDDEAWVYPQELYISGNTLIVLYNYYIRYLIDEEPSAWGEKIYYPYYNYRSVTEAALYDISDPANPSLINSFGQDGYATSSRLQDGILYLITSYWIFDVPSLLRDKPETFVPSVYNGGVRSLVAYGATCIIPDIDSTAYTVVTSLDVAKRVRIDEFSMLGSCDSLYMSYDNLYLVYSLYDKQELNSYEDGSFTVTNYRDAISTRITKLSIDKGQISFITDTLIPGSTINQFALDEHKGFLRVVTTLGAYYYRILNDGGSDIYDYGSYTSDPTTNALFVLDASLQLAGSIEGLAEDERVYSVRFAGDVGYFVTFEQVDPLFTVDLSDPKNPKIQSELKIPGFSSYLHMFDEGKLFGLGVATDEIGWFNGLKLSMFDVSNPFDVSETDTLTIPETWSDALYNHKSAIINLENNLIGFPIDSGYAVFGYKEGTGFFQRMSFEPEAMEYGFYRYYNMRGLFIDDYFYVSSNGGIFIFTLEDLEYVTTLSFEVEDGYYYPIMPLVEE